MCEERIELDFESPVTREDIIQALGTLAGASQDELLAVVGDLEPESARHADSVAKRLAQALEVGRWMREPERFHGDLAAFPRAWLNRGHDCSCPRCGTTLPRFIEAQNQSPEEKEESGRLLQAMNGNDPLFANGYLYYWAMPARCPFCRQLSAIYEKTERVFEKA